MTAPSPPPSASPAPREKPLRRLLRVMTAFISRRALTLCWFTYAFGIVWVLLHPAVTISTGELKPRGTYMSENALLVDSIDAQAAAREEVQVREYHKAFLNIEGLPAVGCGESGDCTRVTDWLENQLRAINRVDAFRHRVHGANSTNVYGILRASPLADHKESIVLVTHYRNIGPATSNAAYSGVALGLALLKFLSQAKWLAKDVILLLAEDGPLDGVDGFAPGTDAWLRAYHSDPLDYHDSASLPMRAGLIRAALNLETIGDVSKANCVGVFTAGINGQLPNLDLVNTVVSHTRSESVPVVLDRCMAVQQAFNPYTKTYDSTVCSDALSSTKRWMLQLVEDVAPINHRVQAREYVGNLFGMLRFMKTLATGPSGLHGSFISYNIDAVTLSVTQSVDVQHWQGAKSIRSILRSLELVVRSLSNLEEKLHQSFFLYVLPNNHDFISVGEYYYTVALAVSPAIAYLLLTAQRTTGMRVAFALVVTAFIGALGACAIVLATRFSVLRTVIAVTVAQIAIVTAVVPRLREVPVLGGNKSAHEWQAQLDNFEANKPTSKSAGDNTVVPDGREADTNGWRALKCVCLALIVYAHCIMGIINYPMALFCALPMAIFATVEPFRRMPTRSVKSIAIGTWLMVSSPLFLYCLLSYVDAAGTNEALIYFARSFSARTNLLALPYLCCLYIPVHTISLAVWLSPTGRPSNEKTSKQ